MHPTSSRALFRTFFYKSAIYRFLNGISFPVYTAKTGSAGVAALILFATMITDVVAMSLDPIFQDLKTATARCQVIGDKSDWQIVEKTGCIKINKMLARRFGSGVMIEHVAFSEPKILDADRLLVVLSGRIEAADEVGAQEGYRYLSISITVSRAGKNGSLLPVAPTFIRLPLDEIAGREAGKLIDPVVEKLMKESGF